MTLPFFQQKSSLEGWRLACQAYVKGQFTIQIEDYEEDQIQAASAFNLSADKSVSNKFTAADTVSDSSSKSASVQHISMQPSSEKSDSKIATAPSSSTHNEISSYDSLALAVDIGTTTIASISLIQIKKSITDHNQYQSSANIWYRCPFTN